MENNFLLWLQKHKYKSITRPEKYVSTIKTISNHLSDRLGFGINLYNIQDVYEVQRLKDLYFSFSDYYEKNKTGNRMYSRAFDLYLEFIISNTDSPVETEQIIDDKTLSDTEKESVILSRIGQGVFRSKLMKLWNNQCVITGVSNQSLLIASHIKPWKISNNNERIDKFNGFLLLPTYDKLFDLGFISFQNNGSIIISNKILEPEKLHISDNIQIKLFPQNIQYLEYHRNHIFSYN